MPGISQLSGHLTSFQQTKLRWANLVGNHAKAGFITAFSSVREGGLCLCSREFIRRDWFESAKADFACVAANLFAGIGFLHSVAADFACVAANK